MTAQAHELRVSESGKQFCFSIENLHKTDMFAFSYLQ